MDVTSALKGFSFSLPDLLSQVSARGWEVKKIHYDKKSNQILATAKAPHGEEAQAFGPTPQLALGNLLHRITHLNGMRIKTASWTHTFTDQLVPIAEAYSKAPIYEPKAAAAFMELAHDSVNRASALQEHLEITLTHNPDPYPNAEKMSDDIRKRHKLEVSLAGADHPIWSRDEVVAYRIVHDVLGYCASGGGFDWEGENRAFAAHAAIIPAEAQKALFTESVAQTAYATYYKSYGPQKVAIFSQFMDEAQAKENPHAGFRGIHPSQIIPPVPEPSVKPKFSAEGREDRFVISSIQKSAQGIQDPNEGWSSGAQPGPGENAYLEHGDPLQSAETMNNAGLIQTEWAELNKEDPQDVKRMKQAITNAFRVVLLSPRKDLRWNAIHYQDISHVPDSESDPSKYWDTLETARQNWNVERHGEGARYAHLPYYQEWKQLEQLEYQKNPQAGWDAAVKTAKDFVYRMMTRLQEQVEEEDRDTDPEKQKNMFQIEREAVKRMSDFLKKYIAEHQMNFDFESAVDPQQMGFDIEQPEPNAEEQIPDKSKYEAFIGRHLQAIAQISEHVDQILEAALWDVHESGTDGAGHHFRSVVLSLQIPGVGPKVCSFAWLLLRPLTSQLATIDTHMLDVLGHTEKDMNPRDYFKFERELAAGRDASGYSHVPLGAFQWGMWDYKRTGPGSHQDHSAMKVLDPTPHDQIDWAQKVPPQKGENWIAPDWWQQTQQARDQVSQDYDQTIGSQFKKSAIPYVTAQPRFSKQAASTRTPWILHPETGERIVGQPGQTIMQHIRSLGLNVGDAWQKFDDNMVGKEEQKFTPYPDLLQQAHPGNSWVYASEQVPLQGSPGKGVHLNGTFHAWKTYEGYPHHPQVMKPHVAAALPQWSVGQYGKGLITPMGGVVHWGLGAGNQDPDSEPTHSEVTERLGYPNVAPANGFHYFAVNPDGQIRYLISDSGKPKPEAYQRMLQANPKFYLDEPHTAGNMDHFEDDSLHVGLDVPRHAAKTIYRWARDEVWPPGTELEEPDDYHITILYAPEGHSHWGDGAWWLEQLERSHAKIVAVDAFEAKEKGGYAYVLRLDAPGIVEHAEEMMSRAERMGLEVSRFPGGFKPHITVAYGPTDNIHVEPPDLSLDVGPSSISPRRESKVAALPAKQPQQYSPAETQVLDHLSLASVAHNLHYKFEAGTQDPEEIVDYAHQLLKLIGYPQDNITTQAALQAWQQLYPQDKMLPNADRSQLSPHADIEAPATEPTKSWGYGTTSKLVFDQTHEGTPDRPDGLDQHVSGTFDETQPPDWVYPTQPSLPSMSPGPDIEPYSPSTSIAMGHTGQIPGDENLMGDLQLHALNPDAGVNPSYLGEVNNQSVYVKPAGNYHTRDLSNERASFAIAHAMGIPMPHTVIRQYTNPLEWDADDQVGQVQQSVGGYPLINEMDPEEFCETYPDEARRIALLDNVIHNHDRHLGNVIRGDDGQIYPIDHGGAFQSVDPFHPFSITPAGYFGGMDLTPEEMEMARRARNVDVTHMGLPPIHQEAMEQRLSQMLSKGKFLGDLHARHYGDLAQDELPSPFVLAGTNLRNGVRTTNVI